MQSTKQSWFSARWYYLPEETHAGRQSHHAGREIFSSRAHDECEVNTILRTAKVISMHEYYHGGDIGDDIFVCDYEYDHMWQRFRRHAWDDFAAEEDTSSSDDENGDATYTAMDALRAERGEDFGRRRRHGRRLKRQQGGFDFGAQLGARVIPAHVRAEGPQSLKQACHALTLTVTPQSLPCRENENASVKQFVEKVLATDGGAGKCLYVSGIPGTGKTATVLEVMRNLRRRSEVGELPHFHFVEINGLRLPTPQHAYSQLYEALTGECMGPSTAAAALDDLFAGKPRHGIMRTKYHTIVMLDEMDSLVNKTQNVLYNLFDWPSRASSRLSIIGIANTMDLPERLHPRIGSRLAGCRIVFHPYQRDQLETIMHSRLEGCSAFERGAITFVARKVANCSGDVRRCLELCRRAAEIAAKRQQNTDGNPEDEVTVKVRGRKWLALQQSSVLVGHPSINVFCLFYRTSLQMKDVDSAIREAFSTPHIKMVRDSSTLELLLLCAIVLESRYTGQCEVYLDNAASRLSTLGNTTIPPFSALLQCAVGLAARKVVLCDAGHKRLKAKLALNVPVDDISYVLSNDPDLSWLAERLK